jgi:hypothetical protein
MFVYSTPQGAVHRVLQNMKALLWPVTARGKVFGGTAIL